MNRTEMTVESRLAEIERDLDRVITFLKKVTEQEAALENLYNEATAPLENIEGVENDV